MGTAWTVSDGTLYRVLSAWLSSLAPQSWFVLDLYVNDYTPQPGDDAGRYVIPTEAQWPGYIGAKLPATSWAEPSVVADVAETYQPDPAIFEFPQGIASFTVYGYRVIDGYGNLMWAEEFETPIPTSYPGTVSVQPYFHFGILPTDSESFARELVGRADDDDDQGGEG